MALTQQTFLGSSIRGFNGSVGWNNQASTLSVDLVDDPANGDSFDPPDVGTAVIFNYSDWQFGGLLQGYTQDRGEAGNPVYNVQIKDPRELLAGVQLILNDYTGTLYNTRNIYNIYGYLESSAFGASNVNDTGMEWTKVRDAFYQLQLVTPIYFRGVQYIFNPYFGGQLDTNVYLPEYYRIPGDSISALEFVENVCGAVACDFFITMIPLENDETPATNAIIANLISRNNILEEGKINEFVDSVEGAKSKNQGYELRNETMTKFLVGGKLNNMHFRLQGGTANNEDEDGESVPENFYDDVILPFWGWDAWGNLVIGTGDFEGPTGKEYTFELDGKPLYVQTGLDSLTRYKTDLAEMRAARSGQKAWESFLWFHNDHEDSTHVGKAEDMGLTTGKLSDEIMGYIKTAKDTGTLPPIRGGMRSRSTEAEDLTNQHMSQEEHRKRIAKIYRYIADFANNYYGKKFMVRVPFVAGAIVPETIPTKIKLSYNTTDTGYVDEANWAIAQNLGYMPYNPEKFTDQNSKLYCYCRFGRMTTPTSGSLKSRYGLDQLSPESFILDQYGNARLGKMRENLFVKCSIDKNLVFLNPVTLYSPRAVVTLDGPVSDNIDKINLHYTGLLREIAYYIAGDDIGDNGEISDELEAWIKTAGSFIGNDMLWNTKDSHYEMPDIVVVPLESNILRYGPWVTESNAIGRVEFENDSTLVPWEYGSFTAMNRAGWANVNSALSNQYQHENGIVEFPGVPDKDIGDVLLESGPVVTDVNVSVAEDGVTTTYRMNTWNHQFGLLAKYNVERFTNMSKMAQKQRKAFRKLYGYGEPINYLSPKPSDKSEEGLPDEPSSVGLLGEMSVAGSGDTRTVKPSVAVMSERGITRHLDDDVYATKAGISLDGVFVPYSTNPATTTDFPHFETPSGDAILPTVSNLNPFGGDGMTMAFPESDTLPDRLVDEGGEIQAVGLRGPVIIGGWGYDTNGNPVPSSGDGGFISNYKDRADEWKTGPLDVRWDDSRKVWTVPGSGDTQYKPKCRFKLRQDLTVSDEYKNGEIDIQYGFGKDHLIHSSGVSVWNLRTSASGTYEFYGDSGDYGIASYDPTRLVDPSGFFRHDASGVYGRWYIDMMECP